MIRFNNLSREQEGGYRWETIEIDMAFSFAHSAFKPYFNSFLTEKINVAVFIIQLTIKPICYVGARSKPEVGPIMNCTIWVWQVELAKDVCAYFA